MLCNLLFVVATDMNLEAETKSQSQSETESERRVQEESPREESERHAPPGSLQVLPRSPSRTYQPQLCGQFGRAVPACSPLSGSRSGSDAAFLERQRENFRGNEIDSERRGEGGVAFLGPPASAHPSCHGSPPAPPSSSSDCSPPLSTACAPLRH